MANLNLSFLEQGGVMQILRSLSSDCVKNDDAIGFGFILINQDVVSRGEFEFVTFQIEKAF